MGSWLDEAKPVQAAAAPRGSWLSEAKATGNDVATGLEAAGRGAAQGLSLGFADELRGVAHGIAGKLGPVLDDAGLLPDSVKDEVAGYRGKDFSQLYREGRDDWRQRDQAAHAAAPLPYVAGELVGGLGPAALVPGGAVAKTGLAGLKAAAGSAAALGAVQGLGSSTADLTQGDVGGAVQDTALGAGLGAGAGVVGHGLGVGLQKVARGLGLSAKELANEQAVSALRPTAGETRRLLRKDQLQDLGDFLLKHEAVTAGATPESVALNLEGLNAAGGQQLGLALQDLDATGLAGIDKQGLIRRLGDLHSEALKGGPALRPVADRYAQAIMDVINGVPGNASFTEAEAIKRGYQSAANYAKMAPSLLGEADINIASAVRQSIEDAADQAQKAVGFDAATRFKTAKDLYGKSAQALELAEGAKGRALARNLASPSDKAAAMMAAAQAESAGKSASHAGIMGAVSGAVNNQVRRRAASTLAVGADRASSALLRAAQTSPAKLGQYGAILTGALQRGGTDEFNAHAFVLGQTDPKFQELTRRLDEESSSSEDDE